MIAISTLLKCELCLLTFSSFPSHHHFSFVYSLFFSLHGLYSYSLLCLVCDQSTDRRSTTNQVVDIKIFTQVESLPLLLVLYCRSYFLSSPLQYLLQISSCQLSILYYAAVSFNRLWAPVALISSQCFQVAFY